MKAVVFPYIMGYNEWSCYRQLDLSGRSASEHFLQKRHEALQDIVRLGNLSGAPSLCKEYVFHMMTFFYCSALMFI